MEKGRVVSGIEGTGAEENVTLRDLNARCWREVHNQGWSFRVRRFNGATTLEKLGMNLQ
jgi:hypothetical protein